MTARDFHKKFDELYDRHYNDFRVIMSLEEKQHLATKIAKSEWFTKLMNEHDS